MTTFFTDAFNSLPPEEREAYHRTVFMHMDTPRAAEPRRQYYADRLRHMGKSVRIGCGVKLVNPQNIWLADHVCIGDNCVLFARSDGGARSWSRARGNRIVREDRQIRFNRFVRLSRFCRPWSRK